MIARPRLTALTVLFFCAAGALAQQAALFDELTPLFPDSTATDGAERYALAAPRGVPAGVHVLVTGLPADAVVAVALTEDDKPVADARLYRLIDVPVEQNTGLHWRTEIIDGKDNPHVIRDAPFRVFEAMAPFSGETTVNAAGVAALRVELPVAANAKPGTRVYDISLSSGAWKRVLRWELLVADVVVPPTSPASPGYTNWFNPGAMAQRHGLTPWSEEHWRMIAKYADLMARGRQNTFWVRWSDFVTRADDGALTFDTPRFKRYAALFLDRGFTRIEGGHVAGRHAGDWDSPQLDLVITGSDVLSDAGRRELAVLIEGVRGALDELHAPQHVQYLQHLADEPTDANAETYIALADEVRRLFPGVRIFDATMSLKLVGAVDDWCPLVHSFQQHRDFFEARRKEGGRVWVYTCLLPGGAWINRLLDQERVRPVYISWALVKYDLEGYLHWGLNQYRGGVDPFEQSVVPHQGGPPKFLPAGDTHIVYPGPDGPFSGQRFEAQRIGMEDAELLRMLRAKNRAQADALIDSVFRSFNDYEKDVSAYRKARRKLLDSLGDAK